jgi:SPP1 gp7 family putative phage head morphogenesis protein
LDCNYSIGGKMKPMTSETSLANFETALKSGTSFSENPDKIINSKGWDYIDDIERDTHLGSCINTRIQSVVSKGFKIIPHSAMVDGKMTVLQADREIADFVEFCLNDIPTFETDIIAMLDAVGKGFSLSEINYKYVKKGRFAGKVGLLSIRKKPCKNFSFKFDKYGNYEIRQNDPEQLPLQKDKFVHFIAGRDDENPYGESASSRAAFWVWLKKNVAKFWAIYAERFGMPLADVSIPSNIDAGSPEYKKAEEVLTAMLKDSGIIRPKNFDIGLIEATRSGDAGYDNFLERCNKEISKIVLGQTLSNEEGKRGQGSYALGSVHQGILNNYTLFDVIISAAAINSQLVRRLVDFNYETEHYPKFSWNSIDLSLLTVIAQNISALVSSGIRIPVKMLYDAIGIPVPDENEEILEKTESIFHPQSTTAKGMDNRVSLQDNETGRAQKFAEIVPQKIEQQAIEQAKENDSIVEDIKVRIAQKYSKIREYLSNQENIDFDILAEKVTNEIQPELMQTLIIADILARKHVVVKNLFQEETALIYDPFEQTIKDFVAKGILSWDEYMLLESEMRRKAFTVARVESEYVIEKIKNALDEVFAGGGGIRDFHILLDDIFRTAGISPLSASHIEVILRNNFQTAYSRAKEAIYEQLPEDEFPSLMVMAILDGATRPSHRALHGFTRPKNDPIWRILKTPFDHNCRCTIVPIHKSENMKNTETMPDLRDLAFVGV